jgi:prolipoprotein diacylglyceryltransferase
VTALPSVITIGIDPTIELGPVTIAWHGLTIAIGILIGGLAVALDARRRGLDPERVYAIGLILVVGALVGGRAFYLLEHGQLDDPASGWAPPGSRSTAASSRPPSGSPTTSGASG